MMMARTSQGFALFFVTSVGSCVTIGCDDTPAAPRTLQSFERTEVVAQDPNAEGASAPLVLELEAL